MAKPDYRIEPFGGRAQAAATAVELSELHEALLEHSPVVLMGKEFLREFYYSVLPSDGLIFGAIAYVDRKPAGFMVATASPADFMSRAIRSHWLRLCWIMCKSLLRNPGRLVAVKEAYLIQRNVQTEDYGAEVGELLSFGVLPEFRSRRFIKETGFHISSDLLATTTKELRGSGKRTLRAIVDKDNLAAQLFYRSNGWRVGLATVKGWRVPTMEFLLDLD